tara:strand:+ start:454 stop:1617 length:1164 start_codon:yes stop_codon:yes gene_type:complete
MRKQFLDLGKQPIANGFLHKEDIKNEYFFNLGVAFDEDTKLVTQTEYVDPPLMFNDTYMYRGSMSKTSRDHFKLLSSKINPESRVLEIGSNDGVFIKHFDTSKAISVEPCGNFAKETQDMGYTTYAEFWSRELADKINTSHGKQDIIFAANCMCHIPELNDAFSAIESLLSENGTFIFEDPSLAEVVNNNSYDQIYDEHPHVFSVIALDNILKRSGLQITRVENLPVHGGSNRIFAGRIGSSIDETVEQNKAYERILGLDRFETYQRLALRVEESKNDLVRLLTRCKEEGKKVISYGATSKSTTVFNYCGIGPDLIDCITDTTPEKQGKLSPGMHIPVIAPGNSIDESVDYAYLGAWNFITEIKGNENDFIDRGGKFMTHVPVVRFV